MRNGLESWEWLREYVQDQQFSQIIEMRRKIERTLSNNVLPHFTDHSLSHSDRVAAILGQLVSENLKLGDQKTLRKDELFILALSAILHDTGMQIPKAHGIETPISELSRKELHTIRRDHGKVSGAALRQILNDQEDILGIGVTEGYVKRRLPHVATVCENHQSAASYEPDEVTKLGNQKIRIGLLTGLFRLADQLDCDYKRVELERLDHFSIPIDSVLHWLLCSYVDAVSLEGGLIQIMASFPESMTGPEVDYLSGLLIEKIHLEYDPIEETLWQNNIRLRPPDRIIRTRTDYTFKKPSLPSEITDTIKTQLSAEEPHHVESAPPGKEAEKEVDWMSYWKVIGNPFLDRPVAYGSKKFVETAGLQQMLAEVSSFVRGSEGELKLVIGTRGLGKTTLFESIAATLSEDYTTFVIDVADRIGDVRTVADLRNMIFYSIHDEISVAEPTGRTDEIVQAARLGRKKVICVDSMDRLTEDQDSLVVDFFKSSQYALTKLRTVSVVLFACADRWGRFLASKELSYLGYRNQWRLSPFTSEDILRLLDRRLKSSGSSFKRVFQPGCEAVLRTLSNGNPRLALEHAESICRLGAQREQERISPQFIRREYEKEFDQALEKLLDRLVETSMDFRKALMSIYHYYLEMERRGLDTAEGWRYLIKLVESNLPLSRIQGAFKTPLRYVSESSGQIEDDSTKAGMLVPRPFLRPLFKQLKKEGYSARDFIMFYSTNPVSPSETEDDLEVRFKSPLLIGPDVEYFEKSRQIFIATRRSTDPAFKVISKAWNCIEDMILAILLKVHHPDVQALIARREEWLTEDRYGERRYVRGAGKLRADHAYDLTRTFVDYLKQKQVWMSSLVSLHWIRGSRANVVRGKTRYLTQFGEREKDLCLRHLEATYKDLSKIYG